VTVVEIVCCVAVVGALIGCAAAHQRIRTLVARLGDLAKLDDLRAMAAAADPAERLRPVEEALRRMGDALAHLPAPVEAKDLLPVQERLEQLARQVQELRLHIDELRAQSPNAPIVPIAPGSRLLRALEERGFESVHILGELTNEEGHDPHRVPVEARRAGMSFKGYVTVEDGRLVEVALKPLTEIFP